MRRWINEMRGFWNKHLTWIQWNVHYDVNYFAKPDHDPPPICPKWVRFQPSKVGDVFWPFQTLCFWCGGHFASSKCSQPERPPLNKVVRPLGHQKVAMFFCPLWWIASQSSCYLSWASRSICHPSPQLQRLLPFRNIPRNNRIMLDIHPIIIGYNWVSLDIIILVQVLNIPGLS